MLTTRGACRRCCWPHSAQLALAVQHAHAQPNQGLVYFFGCGLNTQVRFAYCAPVLPGCERLASVEAMNIEAAISRLLSSEDVTIVHDARRTIAVRGKDAIKWLHNIVTADVHNVPEGGQCYGLLLEKKGKIVSDFIFFRDQSGCLLSVPSPVFDQVFETFDRHIIMEDVELSEHGVNTLVEQLMHPGLGPVPRGRASSRFGLADAAPGSAIPALSTQGVGLRALLGIPVFGLDFGTSEYPQEAGITEPAVSFSKGCYLGQEVVYMLQMRGHATRNLRTVVADEGIEGELFIDDKAVGQMRSLGKFEEQSLGFAMLKRAHQTPATELRDAAGRHCSVLG